MAEERRGSRGRPAGKGSGHGAPRKSTGAKGSGAKGSGAKGSGAKGSGAKGSGAKGSGGAGGRSKGASAKGASAKGAAGDARAGAARPAGRGAAAGGTSSRQGGPVKRGGAGVGGGRAGGAPRSSGRSRPERPNERPSRGGGGFGPYAVDRRDEETREGAGARTGSSRSGGSRGSSSGNSSSRGSGARGAPAPAKRAGPDRPVLRTVGKRSERRTPESHKRRGTAASPAKRRRRRGPADVQQEMARVAGRNANRAFGTLMAAADAFAHDREREALRILRPLREQAPDSPSVRELAGLCHYRIGNYAAASKELEAYASLSDSVDQNPVLMDCYRALKRWRKVEELWLELAQVSPTAGLVAEGRIVYAGALADQGRLPEALTLLRKRAESVKSPAEHHLRLWYALGDLEERAGNLARARELFHQVRRADPAFSDVAERLAALG
jgi:predicted Zn-dependent protease